MADRQMADHDHEFVQLLFYPFLSLIKLTYLIDQIRQVMTMIR